ncbi:MAG TPA: LysR family transcriptional regulator [Castellaniella sp.]|nr:LysR family transcriptional regulator [Castellaniella sp.]
MDRIQDMQVFKRVAELSGFSAAADSLGLPKATVSGAVRRLEDRLGTRLLHRTTRRVRLTQDGEVFYQRCHDLLAEMEELETLFLSNDEALSGVIRTDMSNGILQNLILGRLPEFLEAHPLLKVEMSSTDQFVDLVRGGFDCVFRVGEPGDVNLAARRLGRLPFVNGASPAYLERHGVPRTLDDLRHHRLIHYVSHLGADDPGFEYPVRNGYELLPMPGALTVNHVHAYESAAIAGLGIIQAPEARMRQLIDSGQMVEILPQYRPRPLPVSVLYPGRRHLARRTLAFMDWAQSVVDPILEKD